MDIGREIRTYAIEPLRIEPVQSPTVLPAAPEQKPVEVPA
jgi:hypothetical protein